MIKLYDNSRLSDHRRCNRYFYWRHRRHLSGTAPNIPADFGSCWSKAQDVLWPELQKSTQPQKVIPLAFEAFVTEWKDTYNYPFLHEMTDEQVGEFKFRHDQTALEMLYYYIERRETFIKSVEILAIEKPFIVPLSPTDPDLLYVGKVDKEIRWEGRVWGLDHKTTSWYRKSGGFAPDWIDGWHLKSQPMGYIHQLRMRYGKEAKGVLIDGALVHANVHDAFTLIPIEKHYGMLETWLWEALHEATLIEANDRNLEQHKESKKINVPEAHGGDYDFMPAFPKNDNSCIHFMKKCAFFDLCNSVPDPEAQPDRVPEGFVVRKWEPFDELQLEKLGVKMEDSQ